MTHHDDTTESDSEPRAPFWERKTLAEMTRAEWESLCDGCAQCCMIKLQDEGSGVIVHTAVVCQLLDTEACRCTAYADRHSRVPDCIEFTPDRVLQLSWLPKSCAYRRVAEGRGLAAWHPLVSGDPATVVEAGVSVRGRVVSESDVPEAAYEDMVVRWVDC
ncbi:MAG: YcgN family cysteine cluster protein [Pseudomonadota bacterium]